jgi:hypothetical protein
VTQPQGRQDRAGVIARELLRLSLAERNLPAHLCAELDAIHAASRVRQVGQQQ